MPRSAKSTEDCQPPRTSPDTVRDSRVSTLWTSLKHFTISLIPNHVTIVPTFFDRRPIALRLMTQELQRVVSCCNEQPMMPAICIEKQSELPVYPIEVMLPNSHLENATAILGSHEHDLHPRGFYISDVGSSPLWIGHCVDLLLVVRFSAGLATMKQTLCWHGNTPYPLTGVLDISALQGALEVARVGTQEGYPRLYSTYNVGTSIDRHAVLLCQTGA
jgi:hypothetical protein